MRATDRFENPPEDKKYYFYSDSLGLVENTADHLNRKMPDIGFFETPNEAYASYYAQRKLTLSSDIRQTEILLRNQKLEEQRLDQKFGHLKDILPEMFI